MMVFIPKNVKFQKLQKKHVKNVESRNVSLVFGTFALKATENGIITSKQLDMLNLYLAKNLKKGGHYWIRIFPHYPITAKPLEVRMGKGKGYVDRWVCKVRIGSILCEVAGVSLKTAVQILKKISVKLPVATIFVDKNRC